MLSTHCNKTAYLKDTWHKYMSLLVRMDGFLRKIDYIGGIVLENIQDVNETSSQNLDRMGLMLMPKITQDRDWISLLVFQQ